MEINGLGRTCANGHVVEGKNARITTKPGRTSAYAECKKCRQEATKRWAQRQTEKECIEESCTQPCRPGYKRCYSHQWPITLAEMESRPRCSVDGCDRRNFGSGLDGESLCQSHWLRKPGNKNAHIPMDAPLRPWATEPEGGMCSAEGCDYVLQPIGTRERDNCGFRCPKHHGERSAANRASKSCSIESCTRNYTGRGYCSYHLYRLDRLGDPLGVLPPQIRRGMPRQPEVKYSAAHNRVRRDRGHPTECAICGSTDPTKKYRWVILDPSAIPQENLRHGNADGDDEGRQYAFSLDPADFTRVCAKCHVERILIEHPKKARTKSVYSRTPKRTCDLCGRHGLAMKVDGDLVCCASAAACEYRVKTMTTEGEAA